ncbi:MAG: glycosyltransferase family 39 protein [Bacteroidetes bacterium]|nr:glycosyltransferase family 39 protein [Bacteroidota bacterium]
MLLNLKKSTKPVAHKIIVMFIGFGSILLAYLLYPNFLGDDTFIHIGFIKDLSGGKGFSFAGTKTYGTTSPMWVIIGAIVTKLFTSPETAVRLLSLVFTFSTLYLLYIILSKANINIKIIYAAILSLALNPFFLRWGLSGMEVTASMSLLLSIYYLFYKSTNKFKWNIGGFVFGLAILTRPEFLGFYLIFIFYNSFTRTITGKKLFTSALITIITLSGWLLFAYYYFGTIIPNTYLYKAGGSLISFGFEYATRTLKLFAAGNLPEFVLLVTLLVALIFIGRRKQNNSGKYHDLLTILKEKDLILPILWIAGFYGFYLLKDVTVISRYSLMLIPFIIIIVALLFNFIKDQISEKTKSTILIIYLFTTIFGYGFITFYVVKPASDEFVKGFQTSYREIASIIKKDSGNRKTAVALTDVGIIGCFSGAKVYDFAGLVDHSRFNYDSSHDYLMAKKPGYVILREEYKPQDILPDGIEIEILFKRTLGGFGINHSNPRTVTLYKLYWK